MSIIRRLRGIAGMALIWGVAWAVLERTWTIMQWLTGPSLSWYTPEVFFHGAAVYFGFGMAAGTLFSLILMARFRRNVSTVRSIPRMALWGFTGGALLPAAAAIAFPGYFVLPSTVAAITATLLFGGVGASLAAGSASVARRTTPEARLADSPLQPIGAGQ